MRFYPWVFVQDSLYSSKDQLKYFEFLRHSTKVTSGNCMHMVVEILSKDPEVQKSPATFYTLRLGFLVLLSTPQLFWLHIFMKEKSFSKLHYLAFRLPRPQILSLKSHVSHFYSSIYILLKGAISSVLFEEPYF